MDNNPVSVTDPLGLSPMPRHLQAPLNRPSFSAWAGGSPLNQSDGWEPFSNPNAPGGRNYAAEDAAFEAWSWEMYYQARSESVDDALSSPGGGGSGTASATQGDASASNASSSEVCNNDESSSGSASDVAGSSDGDDGKKTPMGPFTDSEDPGREIPKGESPQKSDNPLLDSHGEEVYSIEQFVEYNKGRTFEEIIHQRGGPKDKLAGGPKLRYVRHPNDGNIMDMRHVLVVGYQVGNVGGFAVEVAQGFSKKTRPSSFDKQDFYSNAIGARFFDYIMSPNISKDFTTNFYNFIIGTNGRGASGSW